MAFLAWRDAVESVGVFVLQLKLGNGGLRGFSMWHPRAPVAAVNSTYRMEARVYSLLHEVGHLVTRTEAACAGFAARGHERWCDRLAAAILMPRDAVSAQADVGLKPVTIAGRVANRFKVSLSAAIIRLVELEAVDKSFLSALTRHSDANRNARVDNRVTAWTRGSPSSATGSRERSLGACSAESSARMANRCDLVRWTRPAGHLKSARLRGNGSIAAEQVHFRPSRGRSWLQPDHRSRNRSLSRVDAVRPPARYAPSVSRGSGRLEVGQQTELSHDRGGVEVDVIRGE